MRILCVGASHKTAPVPLRERLAFSPPAARAALETLRDRYGAAAFVILSTCNRSELYVIRPLHARPREEEIRAFFGAFHDVPRADYDGALYVHADAEAVRHLFAVAAGLDSLVPGEDQILAQVKQAYQLAQSVNAAGPELNELFQLALSVAKEVRSATRIATGKVSVASVAVDCAKEVLNDLTDKCALSVGAGKMNLLMLRGFRRLGVGRILVANRSLARAAELAGQCDGQAVPFESVAAALSEADLVVCSTAASGAIITAADVRAAMAQRPRRRMLILDIAVPRDVEEQAGQVSGAALYNIDDLRAVVEKNIRLRSAEIDAGRAIVERRTADYFERLHVREVAPTIDSLYRQMRAIADEELAAARKKLTGDPRANEQVLRRAFHRALRRMLHKPLTHLRAAAGTETARQHAAMLRKLFDLPLKPEGR